MPPGGDDWGQDDDGRLTRTLNRIHAEELGPVLFPAYPQTSAQVRAKVDELNATPVQVPGAASDEQGEWQAPPSMLRRRLELEAV